MKKIKEILIKPIYKTIKVWHIVLVLFVIGISVGSEDKKKEDNSSKKENIGNINGDWNNKKTEKIGEYNISIETELNIVSIEDYDDKKELIQYSIKQTILDEYSGGVPKFQNEKGLLKINKDNLEFYGKEGKDMDWNDRGAYIVIPKDRWNTEPKTILVKFDENKGHDILFNRD
jgi:hypothetical protein